jgi:two-component system chemotaxis response regulator CheB
VIAKPGGPYTVADIADQLKYRIRALRSGRAVHFARLRRPAAVRPAPPSLAAAQGLILMGASTGGTQAIEALLTRLPADTPPILIVQHMPAPFTRAFAARLDRVCAMQVVEAAHHAPLARGVAYIAPGDSHLLVSARGSELRTVIADSPRIHYQRPSVDVLFHSAAALGGVRRVALLLTGMGSDGADGLLALRESGAITIAEDQRSCVVFGMPAAAIARGAATYVAGLSAMPRLIAEALMTPRRTGPSSRLRIAPVQPSDTPLRSWE